MNTHRPAAWSAAIVCAFLVVVLFGTTAAHAQKSNPALIEKRAVELTEWIVRNSTFEFVPPPPIVFVPPVTLARVFNGDKTVQAGHFPNMIMLRADFQLGINDEVLLHELVHHLQFVSGKLTYGMGICLVPNELDAYALQNKFVGETGIGQGINGFTLFIIASLCTG